MNEIHEQISKATPWYRNWHKTDSHTTIHWAVFVLVVVLSWFVLHNQIESWLNLSSNTGDLTVQVRKTGGAIISLNPATATIKLNDFFTADIVLDTANNPIDGVDIYALHYDPTILKVVDDIPTQKGTQIQPGTAIPFNAANIVDESTGTIKFGQAAAGGTTFTGKGVIATIHFKAIAEGTSFLKFDFNKGSTVDTNAAHKGKDQLANVVDAIYTVAK